MERGTQGVCVCSGGSLPNPRWERAERDFPREAILGGGIGSFKWPWRQYLVGTAWSKCSINICSINKKIETVQNLPVTKETERACQSRLEGPQEAGLGGPHRQAPHFPSLSRPHPAPCPVPLIPLDSSRLEAWDPWEEKRWGGPAGQGSSRAFSL